MTTTRIYTKTMIGSHDINSINNINFVEERIEEWIKINLGITNE